jgi:hypothetical protein
MLLVQGRRGHETPRPGRNSRGERGMQTLYVTPEDGRPLVRRRQAINRREATPFARIAPCTCDSTSAKGTWAKPAGGEKNGRTSHSSRSRVHGPVEQASADCRGSEHAEYPIRISSQEVPALCQRHTGAALGKTSGPGHCAKDIAANRASQA